METCEARAVRIHGLLWTCDQCSEEPWLMGFNESRLEHYEECTCGGNYVKTHALHGGWRWDPESSDWLWVHDVARQRAHKIFMALGSSARDVAAHVMASDDRDFVAAIAEIEDSGWRIEPRKTIMGAVARRLAQLPVKSASDGK
jgi:hypothetical protein